jgi:hypothetical protein
MENILRKSIYGITGKRQKSDAPERNKIMENGRNGKISMYNY